MQGGDSSVDPKVGVRGTAPPREPTSCPPAIASSLSIPPLSPALKLASGLSTLSAAQKNLQQVEQHVRLNHLALVTNIADLAFARQVIGSGVVEFVMPFRLVYANTNSLT